MGGGADVDRGGNVAAIEGGGYMGIMADAEESDVSEGGVKSVHSFASRLTGLILCPAFVLPRFVLSQFFRTRVCFEGGARSISIRLSLDLCRLLSQISSIALFLSSYGREGGARLIRFCLPPDLPSLSIEHTPSCRSTPTFDLAPAFSNTRAHAFTPVPIPRAEDDEVETQQDFESFKKFVNQQIP